jgi:hypothetical protein
MKVVRIIAPYLFRLIIDPRQKNKKALTEDKLFDDY